MESRGILCAPWVPVNGGGHHSASLAPRSEAEVAEWQTRRSQKPLGATPCGFDSRPRHHPLAFRSIEPPQQVGRCSGGWKEPRESAPRLGGPIPRLSVTGSSSGGGDDEPANRVGQPFFEAVRRPATFHDQLSEGL